MLFQLNAGVDFVYILYFFPLLKVINFESIFIRVKDLNLSIIKKSCKFLKLVSFKSLKVKCFYLFKQ